jgi:2-haloacid dehalogenase
MTLTTLVFDAYGTLFDVTGAARLAAAAPGGERLAAVWPALAADWRQRQLDYTWLRAAARRHVDFACVTADSLDDTLTRHGIDDPALRDRLLGLFRRLPTFPEVAATLDTLRARGLQLAILSNGTPAMIEEAATAAGIADRFDALLSVETAGVYKPHPNAYALVEAHFGISHAQVMFVSGNYWDAAGAAAFGFTSVWVNRTGAPRDRLWATPRHELDDLSGLADLL